MAESLLLNTTKNTRKFLMFFGIFIVIVLIIQLCVNSLKFERQAPDNYAYTPIDNSFGEIQLPDIYSLNDKNNITISTNSTPIFAVDNQFPETYFKGVNVYSIEEPRERFATEDKGADIAERFGFDDRFRRESENKLSWVDGGRRLSFDKVKQEWDFKNLFINPTPGSTLFLRDEVEKHKEDAKQLINSLGLSRDSLDIEGMDIEYLVKEKGSFVEAKSINTAEYMRIRVYRNYNIVSVLKDSKGKPLKNLPEYAVDVNARTVKNDYFSAPLDIIVAGNEERSYREEKDLVSLNFIDWRVNTVPGVYEAYSPTEAWENIKLGKGALKELTEFGFNRYEFGKTNNQEILAFTANYQDWELAYLELDDWKGYLYPIYVFRGRVKLSNSPGQDNADFVFYTYAIKQNTE